MFTQNWLYSPKRKSACFTSEIYQILLETSVLVAYSQYLEIPSNSGKIQCQECLSAETLHVWEALIFMQLFLMSLSMVSKRMKNQLLQLQKSIVTNIRVFPKWILTEFSKFSESCQNLKIVMLPEVLPIWQQIHCNSNTKCISIPSYR